MGGSMAMTVWLVARARAAPVATGEQGLVGETGRAETDFESEGASGRVYVHGENWSARSTSPVSRGDDVVVVGI
jgi:membrane-bound serine protease (ClpP class)